MGFADLFHIRSEGTVVDQNPDRDPDRNSDRARLIAAVRAAASVIPGVGRSAPTTSPTTDTPHQSADDLRAEGAAAERARIAAIIDSEEAKGREKQARYFAFKTAMAPDDALIALAEAPVAEAPKAMSLLEEMRLIKQPPLGVDGGRDVSQMSDFERGAAEARRLLGK